MAKNLIFLADGTGNDGDIKGATNVYKLYQRLRSDVPGHPRLAPEAVQEHLDQLKANGGEYQITQYDVGVGSDRFDLIGKATGKGLSQNIKDGYEFFTRFYEPDDRLYVFGFSRGAYTVRSLAGMIGICGLPKRTQAGGVDLMFKSDERTRLVDEAYRIYKITEAKERRARGDAFIRDHGYPQHSDPAYRAVYMIGVWDTVRSLGIPTRWGDVELPGNTHRFHDHELSPHVSYAFHALSIDDRRLQFHPTIWNEPTEAEKLATPQSPSKQTFEQVWFPGVHCDVGGGYPDDTGLADATLVWMMDRVRAAKHPPKFYGVYDVSPALGLRPRPDGKLHDSRDKFWKKALYDEAVRSVARGMQKPGAREIVAAGDPAPLHLTFLDRFVEALTNRKYEYDPENVRDHPDTKLAREQCRAPQRPVPGPFGSIVK